MVEIMFLGKFNNFKLSAKSKKTLMVTKSKNLEVVLEKESICSHRFKRIKNESIRIDYLFKIRLASVYICVLF